MKGQAIVKAVMAECEMSKEEFFNSLFQESVTARSVAINRLKAAGYKRADIARVMQVNGSTVDYWLKPNVRIRKKASRNRRYRESVALNTAEMAT